MILTDLIGMPVADAFACRQDGFDASSIVVIQAVDITNIYRKTLDKNQKNIMFFTDGRSWGSEEITVHILCQNNGATIGYARHSCKHLEQWLSYNDADTEPFRNVLSKIGLYKDEFLKLVVAFFPSNNK